MIDNTGISGLLPINPRGRNSTKFTSCCRVAITDSEKNCPECGNKVIGWDIEDTYKRGRFRWNRAYTG